MKRFFYFYFFFLLSILSIGFFLRIFGIDWDGGHYFHPDERAIVMTTVSLSFPNTLAELFSSESPLNPHFFAYGSFPMYGLKFFSFIASIFNPLLGAYEKIYFVGRSLSAVADTLTIILVYLLSLGVFRKQAVAILAAFFYALAVLPIQTSHFFVVDVFLTLFVTFTLYRLVRYMDYPTVSNSIIAGVAFGMALATKISAAPLLFPLVLSFAVVPFSKNMFRNIGRKIALRKIYYHYKKQALHIFLSFATTGFVFIILSPYIIIDYKEFIRQTQEQSRMTESAFTFPYTLQYVGKTPYLYELQNIFLWGLGPIITSFAFIGLLLVGYRIFKHPLLVDAKKLLIIFSFFALYFYIVGGFAVGWMRYMLPLYPILCLLAGYFVYVCAKHNIQFIRSRLKNKIILERFVFGTIGTVFLIAVLLWPLSFIQIYTQANTRVQATKWITQSIPPGSTLAVEHWDDRLPVYESRQYQFVDLPLYEPDIDEKWELINNRLSKTDYIIIASNRLYTPLQKLTDCDSLPSGRCYSRTASYYQELFSGNLGFEKIQEFSVYPTVPFLNIQIIDQDADESFTVYDHPKVILFQRL